MALGKAAIGILASQYRRSDISLATKNSRGLKAKERKKGDTEEKKRGERKSMG